MQAGFLRLFALRERDEKEELPLKFSLRILLLNPRMLSCSLNPVPDGTLKHSCLTGLPRCAGMVGGSTAEGGASSWKRLSLEGRLAGLVSEV